MQDWELQALLMSTQIACWAVLITTPVALALCVWMTRARWPGHWLIDAACLLPMALPPTVLGFGLVMGLSERGRLGHGLHELTGWSLSFYPSGAVLAASLVCLPLMVRMMRPAFESMDPWLGALAQTLGASPWKSWWTVTAPLIAPVVFSAMALGWAVAWGESGATLVLAGLLHAKAPWLDGPATVSTGLLQALSHPDHIAGASRLAFVSLGVAVCAVLLSEASRRQWQQRWNSVRASQGSTQP